MTFLQSIATVFRKYADFGGRAGLPEFWWFLLFWSVVATALRTVDVLYLNGTETGSGLATLWSFVTLLPLLAVGVRRLRDGGNGWTQLFWLLVPVAGQVMITLRWCDPARSTPGPITAPSTPQ
jgi:uncharacterized membrane protein YhaH (DUF805 family)